MPASQSHQEYVANKAYVETDGATWHLVLSDASSLTETTSISAALATEIIPTSGYITPAIAFTGVTWDTTTQRAMAYTPLYEYINTGVETIQYRSQILVAVPAGHTRKIPKNITQSSISSASDTITITNHGYVAGDLVLIRVVSGTLDSAIIANTEYEVFNTTANTFQLSLDGVSALQLNGNSSLLQAYVIDRTVDARGYMYYTFPFVTSIGQNQSVTMNMLVGCDTML